MALFGRKKKTEEKKTEAVKQTAAPVKTTSKKSSALKSSAGKSKVSEYKSGQPDKPRIIDANRVLVQPLITEKSTALNSFNQYAFAVSTDTNKVEIKKAIQTIYNITPSKVRIINNLGKKRSSGRGRESKTKDWKKAIITLPPGKSIDIYEH